MIPERHIKGWGHEDWIVNKKEYCGKLLFFEKGKRCSLHFHKLKDETFYLESGKLQVDLIEDNWDFFHPRRQNHMNYLEKLGLDYKKWVRSIILNPGESLYIPVGMIHQIIALEESRLFEFSTQHFENDSYRLIKGD